MFLAITAFSQQESRSQSNSIANNLGNNSIEVLVFDSGELIGTPYLNEEWSEGLIIGQNQKILQYFINYNIIENRIEFSDEASLSNTKALISDNTTIIQIDGRSFQYIDFSSQIQNLKGYFEIIKGFDSVNLLLQRFEKSIVQPNDFQRTGYSSNVSKKPRIKSTSSYYFVENDKISKIQNHKKHSLDILDADKQKLLKKYIQDNDIRFEEDGKGLAKLLNYYVNLK